MLLDLANNAEYQRHYQWLFPRRARGGNREVPRFYSSLWDLAEQIHPGSFGRVKTDVVPAITNGNRRDPDRAAVLGVLENVRNGIYDRQDDLEVSIATMLATRPQRWRDLAAHVQSSVPTTFKAYRYVNGIKFCRDVARQFEDSGGRVRHLGFTHDPWTPWSLVRRGALAFQDRRPGVLHAAEIPFEWVVADILVDDSTFQTVYCRQAEILVYRPANTITTLASEVRVFLGDKEYGATEWGSLGNDLRRLGHHF